MNYNLQRIQPAILTVSYSIFKVLTEEFGFDYKSTKYFAGHSLGEYMLYLLRISKL